MYIIWLLISIYGSLFGDFTAYNQGIGSYKVFPDKFPSSENIQIGVRNFYGIPSTIMLSTAYNMKVLTFTAEYMSLDTYFKTVETGLAMRYRKGDMTYGLSISLRREFIPLTKNSVTFSMSTGLEVSPSLNIHAGISELPYNPRIPLIINIESSAGVTSLLLEGEKYMPLRATVFQKFFLSPRLSFLIFLSTAPYKMGLSVTFTYRKFDFTAFSEIHDTLGQSGGTLVEYAPFKSYN